MGGMGSGRSWQFGADTTDAYRSLDVRWLKRKGFLTAMTSRRITWSRGGEVTGSINVRSEPARVVLNYRRQDRSGEWQAESYSVYLDTTPCHMGGERQWFLCPARGCGRRVAILYGGEIFACRHCHQLAYPSQRESVSDRAIRRADSIRDKLCWPGGIIEGSDWGKPKGMHWRTYDRLCEEHDNYSNRAVVGMMGYLIRMSGRF